MHIVTAWRSMSPSDAAASKPVVGVMMLVAQHQERQQPVDPADVEERLARQPHVVLTGPYLVDPLSVLATRPPCVSTAPFGRPVVPDV